MSQRLTISSGVEIRLYPYYDHYMRMIARIEGTGVRITIMLDYDTVIRSELIPDITLESFVKDMTSGNHPVGKIKTNYSYEQ